MDSKKPWKPRTDISVEQYVKVIRDGIPSGEWKIGQITKMNVGILGIHNVKYLGYDKDWAVSESYMIIVPAKDVVVTMRGFTGYIRYGYQPNYPLHGVFIYDNEKEYAWIEIDSLNEQEKSMIMPILNRQDYELKAEG